MLFLDLQVAGREHRLPVVRESGGASGRMREGSERIDFGRITSFIRAGKAATSDKRSKEVFSDVAREEKTCVGELLTMLIEKDKERVREVEEGKKEIWDMSG